MANTHTYKQDGKPNLFSWDLATECQFIEQQTAGYPKEASLLRTIAKDYIDIIEMQQVSTKQLDNLEKALCVCRNGVWQLAADKLQSLTYYFEAARERVALLVQNPESKIADRSLSVLCEAFSTAEQQDAIAHTLKHTSKKIREKTAEKAWELRNPELVPVLQQHLETEVVESVRTLLVHAIVNMHQPVDAMED